MRSDARRGPLVPVLAMLLLAACGSTSDSPPERDRVHAFSFVVLADPHLYGSDEAEARLQACVDWVAARPQGDRIELVFVVGDHGSRLDRVRAVLDALPVPWVPLLGDNSIQGGNEAGYDAAMAPHYAALAGILDGWQRAPTPVPDPVVGGTSTLQNFSFDHQDVHFVGLDWCTRTIGGLAGEQADLHAFPGGTLPFLEADLAAASKTRRENIVLLSHHPMHDVLAGAGAFSTAEQDALESVTGRHRDHVYANFAGHYHFNWHDGENDGGFEVFVTDATHDDDVTLRLVRVLDDDLALTYEHDLVVVSP